MNLKLIDFGFTAPIQEKKPVAGTGPYMSPGMHMLKSTNYICDDIFAMGVILYIMLTQMQPFIEANKDDEHYRPLYLGLHSTFWEKSTSNTGKNLSFKLKQLLTMMLSPNECERPSIQDIMNHPWMQDFNQTE